MTKNPFDELEKKYQISGLKMAFLLNLNANYYYGLKGGSYTLSKRVLNLLKEKFKVNPEEFKKEFETWKLEKEKELLSGSNG